MILFAYQITSTGVIKTPVIVQGEPGALFISVAGEQHPVPDNKYKLGDEVRCVTLMRNLPAKALVLWPDEKNPYPNGSIVVVTVDSEAGKPDFVPDWMPNWHNNPVRHVTKLDCDACLFMEVKDQVAVFARYWEPYRAERISQSAPHRFRVEERTFEVGAEGSLNELGSASE